MCVVDALKHSMWNRKIRRWMVVWKYFYAFYKSLRKYYNLFVCLFPIIDDYFATCRFEIFRFCLRGCFFRNIEQEGYLFNFLSISGKAWCELWHSSHNKILIPLSWCPSSGYFKDHWSLKLSLKCHRRSQSVYFFYLGPIISLNIQVCSSEAVAWRCSVKKGVLGNSQNS